MNALFHGLKRMSAAIHHTLGGGTTARVQANRPRRTGRRAHLAVEQLETRLTPSGASLTLNAQTLSSSQVYLYWNNIPSCGIYEVNEIVYGATTTIDVTGSDNCTIANLNPYETYTFQIVGGGGITSNLQSVTTFANTPVITATAASWAQVNVSWGYYGPAVSFDIDEEVNGASVGGVSGGAAATNTPFNGSYSFTGLKPSSTYSFFLTYWYDGVEFNSNVQTVTTPSTAVALTATAASSTQVNLAWNSVYEASDYIVYEQVNNGPATYIGSTTTGTSFTATGLSAYTPYTFQVVDVGPWGTNSASQTVTTLPTPVSLSAGPASSSQINLYWNSVPGATDYVVYESGTAIANVPSGTSCPVNGLSPFTAYTFQVYDVGPWGVTKSNVVTPYTLPAAPVVTATALSPTQLYLSWNSVNGAGAYFVDVMINGTWQSIQLGNNVNSYTWSNLSPNTSYEFQVGAESVWQTGTSWSPVASVATLPLAPTLSFNSATATGITLTWNSVACSGYVLANSSLVPIAYLSSGATSYTVSGLSPQSSYQFELGAYNGSGYSWSNVTVAGTTPAAPTLNAIAVSATQIDLFWTNTAAGPGYIIDESVNGVLQQTIFAGTSTTSYVLTGLNADTTYTFQIASYNQDGYAWSSAQSALTYPAAPTFTLQAASYSQVNVAWNSVPGATGYTIAELINGAWQTIATVSGGTTSYSVTGLTPSTSYEFEVGAIDASGTTWAAVETVITPPVLHKILPG